MIINVSYDSSETSQTQAIRSSYETAVNTAVNFFQNTITTPISINIQFGYGSVAGNTISGAAGESLYYYFQYNYSDLYNALLTADASSPVQQAALATLSATDPTNAGGATNFDITAAQAEALNLPTAPVPAEGYVGINSSFSYSWSQSNVAAGTFDAVGIIEHEISEVLGRIDNLGVNGEYTALDLFRYTARGNLSNASAGTAVGGLAQPFAANYNASAQTYFSYNGQTVTLPYSTADSIAAGSDVADWSIAAAGDAAGVAVSGTVNTFSATDLQSLSAIGYAIIDTITQSAPATASGLAGASIALSGVSVAETSPIGGNILTTVLAVGHGVITVGLPKGATISGNRSGSVTLVGAASAINAALATTSYQGNAGYTGTDTLSISTSDSVGDSAAPASTAITVNPLPQLTVAQALAIEAGGQSPFASGTSITIVDTAAHISALTTTQISGLAAFKVTELLATDVAPNLNNAQHIALSGANIVVGEPLPGGVTRVVSWNANGTLHSEHYYGVTGQAYTEYEFDYDANGNFLNGTDWNGTSIISQGSSFIGQGKFREVHEYGITGANYTETDTFFAANGNLASESWWNGATLIRTETFDTSVNGRPTDIHYYGFVGQAYTDYDDVYTNGLNTSRTFSDGEQWTFTYNGNGVIQQAAGTKIDGVANTSYTWTYDNSGHVAVTDFVATDGTHWIRGHETGLTLTSTSSNDQIKGNNIGGGDTFVFNANFAHDIVNDFNLNISGAGHYTISLPSANFANFSAVLSHTTYDSGGALITADASNSIYLQNVTQNMLTGASADFTFHA